MSKVKRVYSRLGVMALMAALFALAALPAMAQVELESAITGVSTEVQSTITTLLPTILGVAGFILVIGIVWKFFRRFVR